MANTIAGMFSTPEAIRDQRIAEIAAAQRQAAMPRGGSISDLNAVVAGGGYLQGQMLGEQLGGMFGLKTREEAKAAQIQDMASNLNLETPQGLALFARMLNNQGMTEEAFKVFELAKAKEEAELNRKVKEQTLKKRNIQVVNSYYDPLKGVTVNEYGYWDPELGKVVKLSPEEAKKVEETGDVKIGTTAESLQESWGG